MRLVVCALVVLLASHGAAARSWPLPLEGAQARQPLLRLARQLMGIGADGERQWKDGTACARNSDCSSGFCADKVCARQPAKKLADGAPCTDGAECLSGSCRAAEGQQGGDALKQKQCAAPSCTDGVLSALLGETDVDCGGACADLHDRLCAAGQRCAQHSDCVSGTCSAASGRCSEFGGGITAETHLQLDLAMAKGHSDDSSSDSSRRAGDVSSAR